MEINHWIKSEILKTSLQNFLNHLNMNNHAKYFTILLVSFLALSVSCGKNNDCVAGGGGAVTIAAFPQHHGKPIINNAKPGYSDSAFVKFSPGSNFSPTANPADYDLVFEGDSGEDHVHITNLKCGDYFIYMTGWDTSINQRVTGGIPYSFSQTSGEIDLNVPVTE